mgnify:CR=1 FL=1
MEKLAQTFFFYFFLWRNNARGWISFIGTAGGELASFEIFQSPTKQKRRGCFEQEKEENGHAFLFFLVFYFFFFFSEITNDTIACDSMKGLRCVSMQVVPLFLFQPEPRAIFSFHQAIVVLCIDRQSVVTRTAIAHPIKLPRGETRRPHGSLLARRSNRERSLQVNWMIVSDRSYVTANCCDDAFGFDTWGITE